MYYFKAEDDTYYTKEGISDIKKKFPSVKKVVMWPTIDDVKNIEKYAKEESGREGVESIAFLAPYSPEKIPGLKLVDSYFFETISLPNKFGILTSGQKRAGFTEAEALEARLGIEISNSGLTMKDYSGAQQIHILVEIVRQKIRHKEATKGFLLTGIPGTGKSYFAKCLAGELGYLLVALNLSVFMEKEDTVQSINDFFKFFETTPGNYILWIDEIEKMFTGEKAQQVMGALLTNINEANNMSATSSFFIVATANNVSSIAKTNPEFFRNGRFDSIIFLMNPKEEDSPSIFNLYIKKQEKKLKTSLVPMAIKVFVEDRSVECKTRSEKMALHFLKNTKSNFTRSMVARMNEEEFLNAINKDDIASKEINDLVDGNFAFNFSIKDFMRISTQIYRQEASQKERFVYTPAEIEFIVNDSYHAYYLLMESKKIDYDALAHRYRPLQTTIKDGIREILAKASNFVEI